MFRITTHSLGRRRSKSNMLKKASGHILKRISSWVMDGMIQWICKSRLQKSVKIIASDSSIRPEIRWIESGLIKVLLLNHSGWSSKRLCLTKKILSSTLFFNREI
eukprot:Lithocolla_globosa_v1_NODE_1825_length_2313_cov_4.717892.p2 type:complete len:105 gc:universal NODE_1825_length_2313_cov_4.717892:1058-1372(+)